MSSNDVASYQAMIRGFIEKSAAHDDSYTLKELRRAIEEPSMPRVGESDRILKQIESAEADGLNPDELKAYALVRIDEMLDSLAR